MANIETAKIKVLSSDHYRDSSLVYPDQGIMVEKKTEGYHKGWCEKIYNLYLNNKTWINKAGRDSIEENRAWSNGTQDTSEIIDIIFGKKERRKESDSFDHNGVDVRDINEKSDMDRSIYQNIDTSPVSIAPKIKTNINETSRSMYYEMSVNAIDNISCKNEELEKYKLYFYKENQKWVDSQMAVAGIVATDTGFMPQNLDELELYAAEGGFKSPYAVSMEDLIKHTFEISDWDKEVAEKVKDDLMTNGYAIIRERYNPEINRVVVEYLDIAYSGMQFSTSRSFKNSEFGYSMVMQEVSTIRQRLNLTDQQASAMAVGYCGQYGNPEKGRWENYNKNIDSDGTSHLGFDSFKIPEFQCEWIDIDNEQYLEFPDNFGNRKTKPYRGEIQENEQLMDDQKRYVRKCSWIVGTEYVYDWGKSSYFSKDSFGQPRLSYRGVALSTTPIMVQIKPFLKGFQLAWIKAQYAISQAIGNGFAVDIGAIKQIAIGKGKDWDPMEVLRYYKQSSFLLYKKKESLSGFGRSVSPPVIPLNNSSFENIRAQFEAMKHFMDLIESTSGISETVTGGQADPNVSKFGMQISVAGSSKIINNIVRAVTDLQEDMSTNVCYKIRSLCRENDFIAESYAQVIGKTRMKAVMDAEKSHVEYGISIEASDISEEKRSIMAMLQSFIAPSADGSTNNMSEGLQIMDMIHQRQNLRRIGLILGYMMKKKAEKMQEDKLANIKAQQAGLDQMEQRKTQASIQVQDFDMERINREWWSAFTVKWGKTPQQVLSIDNMPQQAQQQQQAPAPAQQQMPMEQQQEPQPQLTQQ